MIRPRSALDACRYLRLFCLRTCGIVALALGSLCHADEALAEALAVVFSVEGTVEMRSSKDSAWQPIKSGVEVSAGAAIRTGAVGRVGIEYRDGRLVRLASGTLLEFPAADEIALREGRGFFLNRGAQQFPTISTPVVSTAIRGTEIVVEVAGGSASITVLEGAAECFRDVERLALTDNEACRARQGQPIVKELVVSPRDAVQWTIAVPELGAIPAAGGPRAKSVRDAWQFLLRSDLGAAQRALEGAGAGGERAALEALIALAGADNARAVDALRVAHETDPDGYLTLLAAASLAQARFDLTSAESILAELEGRYPGQAAVAARRAELLLGSGRVEDAETIISAALAHSPNESSLWSVRGFAELIRRNLKAAEVSFDRAVALSPGAGLPRLGLGLVAIGRGDLAAGRAHFLQAVALEPQRALYRSYLAKAFFEEENYARAGEEFKRAIAVDPNDPTPYLYRSFMRLAENRLVESLYDVDESIQRNDKRAVYRSRLMLDSDAAARSANLGRVYSAIGFQQRARVEALRSLSRDYSDFAAHRLLADGYRTLDTGETRNTQLRIADLFAPLSFNVFQDARSDASGNEYSAMFDRVQYRSGIAAGVTTNEDQQSLRGFHTGTGDTYGYFFGVDQFATDGSKDGPYTRDYRTRASFQWQPQRETRMLLDLKGLYRNVREDARQDGFDEFDVDLGFNHRIDERQTILGQIAYAHERRAVRADEQRLLPLIESLGGDAAETFSTTAALNQFSRGRLSSLRSSLQYVGRGEYATLIAGGEVYGSAVTRRENSEVLYDSEGIITGLQQRLRSEQANNLESRSGYSYLTVPLGAGVDIMGGAAYSLVEYEPRIPPPFVDATRQDERFTPKAGLSWSASDNLYLRSAYFETFRKSSLEDSDSIEPTIVGGFNQRFADLPSTFAKNYGLAADYRWSRDLYMGVELLRRDIEEPISSASAQLEIDYDTGTVRQRAALSGFQDLEQQQNFVNAYLYSILSNELVLTFDYRRSDVEYDGAEFRQLNQIDRIASTLRYFDPSGWFGYLRATWRHQKVRQSFVVADGTEQFWTSDCAVGYRLPHRHGTIQLELLNIFDNEFQYDQFLGVDELVAANFGVRLAIATNF